MLTRYTVICSPLRYSRSSHRDSFHTSLAKDTFNFRWSVWWQSYRTREGGFGKRVVNENKRGWEAEKQEFCLIRNMCPRSISIVCYIYLFLHLQLLLLFYLSFSLFPLLLLPYCPLQASFLIILLFLYICLNIYIHLYKPFLSPFSSYPLFIILLSVLLDQTSNTLGNRHLCTCAILYASVSQMDDSDLQVDIGSYFFPYNHLEESTYTVFEFIISGHELT